MNDPLIGQVLCWGGIILVVIVGALPIIKAIRRGIKKTPPEDHLEERNEAAAMLIASYPYPRRVKSIYNLLDKITELEKVTSQYAKGTSSQDS